MSTEEQRKRNREKQKRWQAKHRDLVWARHESKKLLTFKLDYRHLQADFRTFELGDPRDAPDLVPRLIGYCRHEQRPAWGALWALKGVSNSKWAVWFQELEAAGVEPVELSGWAIGITLPIHLRLARSLVAIRVEHVCRVVTGDPHKSPPWLCNQVRVGGKGQCRCIGRILPDGTVERFESLREAGRAVGMSTDWIDYLASTGGVDSGGCRWFDY